MLPYHSSVCNARGIQIYQFYIVTSANTFYSLGDDIIPESGHYRLRNGREAKDPGKRIKVAVVLLLDVYFDSKRRQWGEDNIGTFRANVTKLYDSFISVWNLLHEIYNEGKLRKILLLNCIVLCILQTSLKAKEAQTILILIT